MRTSRAGDLRRADVDTEVTLCGWVAARRDHGGVVFLDLRDVAGLVQVVCDPAHVAGADPHSLRAEYVLRVQGRVQPRPEGTVNPDLATGEVEVAARAVEILNRAEPPPIPINERVEADETLRLKYRYLDLRSDRLQRNLHLRADVNRALRGALDAEGFTEIETPLLIASTPEGARDFVVPARLHPGSFYALPQSPQLFKQLLMVGGLDRYYQLARCLRDEDPRADRQYEFTQLDAEMSFADADDVLAVVDRALRAAITAATGAPPPAATRLTWHDAMARYGTEKPDLRVDLEIVDVTAALAGTEFRAFQAEAVRGLDLRGGGALARSRLDALIERAQALGAAGLVWMRVGDGGALDSPVRRFLSDDEAGALVDAFAAEPGDLLLLVAGAASTCATVLGRLRVEVAPPAPDAPLAPVWIVDFPLFERLDDDGRPVPAHHPFTAPHPDDVELLEEGRGEALLAVRSRSYDLVLNGWELASGSVRIHDPALQARVFAVLGIDDATAQARFGFLLDAFRYGAPPHAGFGLGIDRLVAVLAGEDNIREVIAFPKTQSGADPLTGAPTPLDPGQLRDLGLTVTRRRQP
jgi:aspartyl-tRNA synthetase